MFYRGKYYFGDKCGNGKLMGKKWRFNFKWKEIEERILGKMWEEEKIVTIFIHTIPVWMTTATLK